MKRAYIEITFEAVGAFVCPGGPYQWIARDGLPPSTVVETITVDQYRRTVLVYLSGDDLPVPEWHEFHPVPRLEWIASWDRIPLQTSEVPA